MTCDRACATTDSRELFLKISQMIMFVFSILLLSVLNLYHCSVEIKRPAVLAAGSIVTLFNFSPKRQRFAVVKIILLYMIGIFFNQLSEATLSIRSFSIRLPLAPLTFMLFSFLCFQFQKSSPTAAYRNVLWKSWAAVFAIIILHMLFLSGLFFKTYGYGYEHNCAVLFQMCLYFMVFLFTWEQLENKHLCKVTSIILLIYFIAMMIRGY